MNLVIDNAVEIKQITKTNDKETRTPLGMGVSFAIRATTIMLTISIGQILLKGDNVSLIQSLSG